MFTVTVRHECGLTDTSTTMTSSLKDLALAFVIYKEKVQKYGDKKQIILCNHVEYPEQKK